MTITQPWLHGRLEVSDNGRFFQHTDGTPFFWHADTAWLLLTRLSLDEAATYFEDRKTKGFNIAQVMVIHSPSSPTLAGRLPFIDGDYTRPDVESSPDTPSFWEHMDAVVELAKSWGIYLALVPIWGTNLQDGATPAADVASFGTWLARRYRHHPNIIWLNGGDLRGETQMHIWQALGAALRKTDPEHLITFHPFGRCQSSTWFHQEPWLDFNMLQSGHRDYHQVYDDSPSTWKGPDNWRHIEHDYALYPAKPTVDGEPGYEDIPRGLHYPEEGRWGHDDSRRFAYWAVFAGAAGHTYGQNAVIQMYKPQYKPAYSNEITWEEGIAAPGSTDLKHLHELLISYPYFERFPDQTVIVGDPGFREERLVVTRGQTYLFAYRFTGTPFQLHGGVLQGERLTYRWMDPITGEFTAGAEISNSGVLEFVPPRGSAGNTDMVLVLESL